MSDTVIVPLAKSVSEPDVQRVVLLFLKGLSVAQVAQETAHKRETIEVILRASLRQLITQIQAQQPEAEAPLVTLQ